MQILVIIAPWFEDEPRAFSTMDKDCSIGIHKEAQSSD